MKPSLWERLLGFFIDNKLVVVVLILAVVLGGVMVAPFRGDVGGLPRDPVPVDAIPDVGENQQIVFTKWPGRSPRDVEDQVTYPLTTTLLGISGVRTVRSFSMFGFSSIYVIFEDGVDFYWSRSRILEKIASLPAGTLPDEVAPTLGPDATALGQVFWYTLEGRDDQGTSGGWDQHELRSIQDWTVRWALQSVPGVAEVASVGGYVKEYQVDIDPEAMLAFEVGIDQIASAVRNANLDVGARTMEINRVEYVIRGLGFIGSVEDLEQVVVSNREHTPIRIRDVAKVGLGPAQRRGALDVAGAPAVGGVVVVRHGANPMAVIERVKAKIDEIAPGLPKRRMDDGSVSQVTIVPFYDRTTLIDETLGTLSTALWQQILITMLVVLVMLRNARSSLLIAAVLPLGILGAFVAMKYAGVDANVMALSGIAIAIGTMVDMGIVLTEAIVSELDGDQKRHAIRRAVGRVAPAVLTATLTTIAGFLPVFGLTAAEGKLFRPLAFTKTFAMLAALAIVLVALPAAAHLILRRPPGDKRITRAVNGSLIVVVGLLLADNWQPLGAERGVWPNRLFVAIMVALLLTAMTLFLRGYRHVLAWALERKAYIVLTALVTVTSGVLAWRGFEQSTSWLPEVAQHSKPARALARAMPGLGREYMPPFDEGSFLYMPSTMPHASIGQAQEQLERMDAAIASVPEVTSAVGKLGRADSALDPAPVSMFEVVVNYKPEYAIVDGERVRQWRPHIRSADDIWAAIQAAAELPGVTDAPQLQPIAARIVMLQSGMRAPMGLKIRGPDLETIERIGLEIEKHLKEVPSIRPETVFADRIVGKPYLEIDIDREAIARHGISISNTQDVVQTALGGRTLTHTVEGRERYPVRVRYMRERRDSPEELSRVLVPSPLGHQLPLEQLAEVHYARGPQVIKSEDTFLTGYVVFDKTDDVAEVDVVEQAQAHLDHKIASGDLEIPDGVSYAFAGSYENQLRSEKRLMVLLPLALAIVVLLIYLQFRSLYTTAVILSGVALAVAGGFLLLWLYGKPWFLDLPVGVDLRALFRVGTTNMSVAVWVGFIAVVGIATDDGVVMATYMHQRFDNEQVPKNVAEVRERVIDAASQRSRACVMTTATTILALLPVITSTGRGADLMLPMALPILGGMTVALFTLFVVPTLYAWRQERLLLRRATDES